MAHPMMVRLDVSVIGATQPAHSLVSLDQPSDQALTVLTATANHSAERGNGHKSRESTAHQQYQCMRGSCGCCKNHPRT